MSLKVKGGNMDDINIKDDVSDVILYEDLKFLVGIAREANQSALYISELLQSFRSVTNDTASMVSASEELSVSIKEISNNVFDVTKDASAAEAVISESIISADSAISAIQDISNTSNETAIHMEKLAETSKSITQILRIINDISKQTHLLALNATIEAARAGEAGKGFTVVAKEVKHLAEQTSNATDEIKKHADKLDSDMKEILQSTEKSTIAVNEGQTKISNTVLSLRESAQNIGAVNYKMQEVSSILQQQTEATREIAENISNVGKSNIGNMKLVENCASSVSNTNKILKDGIDNYKINNDDKTLCELMKFDHILFKKKVVDTFLGLISYKPEDLIEHTDCRLDKWFKEVTNPKIVNMIEFKDLAKLHEDIHQYGKDALTAFYTNDNLGALEKIKQLDAASNIILDIFTKISDML